MAVHFREETMSQFEYDHNPEVQYRNRSLARAAGARAWDMLRAGVQKVTAMAKPKDPVGDAWEASEAGQNAKDPGWRKTAGEINKKLLEEPTGTEIAAALVIQQQIDSYVGQPISSIEIPVLVKSRCEHEPVDTGFSFAYCKKCDAKMRMVGFKWTEV
jgi:hypothetical protein